MYCKTYRNPPRRFAAHRRVTRLQLRDAAFGRATTISGAVVTLAAFFTMWIVIMRCIDEDNPYNWTMKHLETGDYAIEQLNAYRLENGGRLPESLEAIGFSKGYRDNIYHIQLPGNGFIYELEYIKMSDTTYCLTFGDHIWGKGQYLSTVGFWNSYCTRFDTWEIDASEGEDADEVYLYEYEIPEWFEDIRVPLDSIVRSYKGSRQQQYMLRICDHNKSTCGWFNNDDTISCITYNCVLQTFDPMLWPDIDYFRDIRGYVMLDGKVCFIADESVYRHSGLVRRNGKGRVFKVPDGRGSIGGERYWYLDIDRNYGGKVTVKGSFKL